MNILIRSDEEAAGMRTVEVSFDTAWFPPVPWLRAVAMYYFDLPMKFRLAYLQPGECCSGIVEFWCDEEMERTTTGTLMSDDPSEILAYRKGLIEFDYDDD